jgi:hypothetical protein
MEFETSSPADLLRWDLLAADENFEPPNRGGAGILAQVFLACSRAHCAAGTMRGGPRQAAVLSGLNGVLAALA